MISSLAVSVLCEKAGAATLSPCPPIGSGLRPALNQRTDEPGSITASPVDPCASPADSTVRPVRRTDPTCGASPPPQAPLVSLSSAPAVPALDPDHCTADSPSTETPSVTSFRDRPLPTATTLSSFSPPPPPITPTTTHATTSSTATNPPKPTTHPNHQPPTPPQHPRTPGNLPFSVKQRKGGFLEFWGVGPKGARMRRWGGWLVPFAPQLIPDNPLCNSQTTCPLDCGLYR